MAKSWDIDPSTGDYIMDEQGKPKQTDSLKIPAYFRLKAKRGLWLFAPDPTWGNVTPLKNRKNAIRNQLEITEEARSALQPILDDGRAQVIDVQLNTTATRNRNSAAYEVGIVDADAKAEVVTIPGGQ